jgi:hypothetical protein
MNREVEVDKTKLIETLNANLLKHKRDYESAMLGYKMSLRAKIEAAFQSAQTTLSKNIDKLYKDIDSLTDEKIAKQPERIKIVDNLYVDMKVPHSYEKEYQTAIDLANWDVNPTLKLSYAEFNCFIQNEWDWKIDCQEVFTFYNSIASGLTHV